LVKKTEGILGVNRETPTTPFCGVWMIVNLLGRKTKAISHSMIFGLASYAPHPIDKSL
jgi:hypothetical protein